MLRLYALSESHLESVFKPHEPQILIISPRFFNYNKKNIELLPEIQISFVARYGGLSNGYPNLR